MSRQLTSPPKQGTLRFKYSYDNPVVDHWHGASTSYKTQINRKIGYRDDIHKNVPDSAGFRPASAYNCDVTEYGGFNYAIRSTMSASYWTPAGNVKATETVTGVGSDYSNFLRLDRAPLPTLSANAVRMCEVKALAAVKDQKVNAALALVEAQRSVDLIATASLRVLRAWSAARRRNWRRACDHLGISFNPRLANKSSSKGWLELQYGWLPLVGDCYGAVEQLQRINSVGLILTGKSRTSYASRSVSNRQIYFGDGTWSAVMRTTTRWRTDVSVRLDFRITSSALAEVAQLGFTNPLTIAWELTPFSFILDWFLPIGNVLDALDAPVGLTYLSGSKTVFHNGIQVEDSVSVSSLTKARTVTGTISNSAVRRSMTRSVYKTPPVPLPYVKSPLSTMHLANAYALWTSLKSR